MDLRIFIEPQQGASYDDQLRVATTAEAARAAAVRLIRERFDAKSDEALVGDAIRSIGSR